MPPPRMRPGARDTRSWDIGHLDPGLAVRLRLDHRGADVRVRRGVEGVVNSKRLWPVEGGAVLVEVRPRLARVDRLGQTPGDSSFPASSSSIRASGCTASYSRCPRFNPNSLRSRPSRGRGRRPAEVSSAGIVPGDGAPDSTPSMLTSNIVALTLPSGGPGARKPNLAT